MNNFPIPSSPHTPGGSSIGKHSEDFAKELKLKFSILFHRRQESNKFIRPQSPEQSATIQLNDGQRSVTVSSTSTSEQPAAIK